jgi:hypothetical protein
MLNFKNMKKLIKIVLFGTAFCLGACDQDFEEINTNPYAVTEIDPALLFAGAQRTHLGNWETEHTIVQQFVNPFNAGATLGPNFNENTDGFFNGKWNESYNGPIKNMIQAMNLLGPGTERVNLMSMLRIWKAQAFMGLVDEYADVPYFQVGLAYSDGIFYPAYDDDTEIYLDLEKELREAVAAFDPSKDYVSADLFYGSNGENPTSTAAAQVEKWKKLGNSLLLRLGMRYSKTDPAAAEDIVLDAFNGGVMTSNADDAYVTYDGTFYNNDANGGLINNNPRFYYAAEPFVDQLKSSNDPRSRFIIANFDNPANPQQDTDPDTELDNQFGVPVGVINTALESGPYRGIRGGGYNYSQMNVNIVASLTAPNFWVTYSQTALLLAEAAHRGWIPGGEGAAQQFYEDAIVADIDRYALYPNATPVTDQEKADFIADPAVAYNTDDALELINTQYWIANIRNGAEAFANFRRSGFPVLAPNLYNNNLNGGFIRRHTYPDYESANNADNYFSAVEAIGGDDMTSRVFWDEE